MNAYWLLPLFVLLFSLPSFAQAPGESPEEFAKRTKWWTDARFGMFIHWGVYAVPADSTRLDGTPVVAEWYLHNKQMPIEEYRKFAPQFNPTEFDAAQWVKTAKDAGMRYIVITSKHHDGFSMWDTKQSDWSITGATPFNRDPIAELARECKKQGIVLCFYHSIMDWSHPDYLPRRAWDTRPSDGADFDRYITYMKAQLKELVEWYGPLGVLWFDGEWENTWTPEYGADLYDYVRSLQPDIIINNRVDKGRQGMEGMTREGEYRGDFGTPEQEIPSTGFPDGRLWETCMTINNTWGYAENDHNWKSSADLIRKLCDIASKGGNFLLNVGPKADGTFPAEINERLSDIGRWMKANSESIYDTSASPIANIPENVRCTSRGNTLYLHVFDWPEEGLSVDGISSLPVKAAVLSTGESLQVTPHGRTGITLSRPAVLDPAATVVKVKAGR